MGLRGKHKRCFSLSFTIINYYDKLLDLLENGKITSRRFNFIIKVIKKLSSLEAKMYNKLTEDELKTIIFHLKQIPDNELSLRDIRVMGRLSIARDKILGNSIVNNDCFPFLGRNVKLSISDIVYSKIMIDTFLLTLKKISELTCTNDEQRKFAKELNDYNTQHALLKLNLYELSEMVVIDTNYDLTSVKPIDLDEVKRHMVNNRMSGIDLKQLVNDKVFSDFMACLDEFEHTSLDDGDVEGVYDNLYFVSYLEVLLDYLDKNQLNVISSYCNGIKFKNKMISGNVRRLIRNKITSIMEEN